MIEIQKAKSGSITATYNGINLHSVYDPEREAEKFIRETIKEPSPSLIIVCGCPVAHLLKTIKTKYPDTKTIALFYSGEIEKASRETAHTQWSPAHNEDLRNYLLKEINELDLDSLQIIEWAPSRKIFPEISGMINTQLNQVINEYKANIVTTSVFGVRWIKNTLLNFVNIEKTYRLTSRKSDKTVWITGSGPSLEKSASLLRTWQENVFIISLPSSLQFLTVHGIKPDLVLLTDPGYYSLWHLFLNEQSSPVFAMPFSAVNGICRVATGILPLLQPYFFEKEITRHAGLTPPVVPSHGTVAATALDLSLQITSGKIILSGLDFAYRDIQSHIRPSGFENRIAEKSGRLSPFYSRTFSRAVHFAPEKNGGTGKRTSRSLTLYWNWFNTLPPAVKSRLVQFHATPNPLQDIDIADKNKVEKMMAANKPAASEKLITDVTGYPDFPERKTMALKCIEEWRDLSKTAIKQIRRQSGLSPFFSSGKLLDVCYFTDLRGLLALKRSLKSRKTPAIITVTDYLSSIKGTLELLYKKITNQKGRSSHGKHSL
ncbi:MAG: DUF115 domain-containing protein [Spirochaetales bacterium]|nr:DUF115 domain-containing protein [Spirochaetales bacterium]